jgi:hypothetical protein
MYERLRRPRGLLRYRILRRPFGNPELDYATLQEGRAVVVSVLLLDGKRALPGELTLQDHNPTLLTWRARPRRQGAGTPIALVSPVQWNGVQDRVGSERWKIKSVFKICPDQ